MATSSELLPPPMAGSADASLADIAARATLELETAQANGPALSQLAGLLWPMLRRYVAAHGWGVDDEETIVGDTLATVLSRLPSFQPGTAKFSSWTLGIARLQIKSELRKKQRRESPPETVYETGRRQNNHFTTRLVPSERQDLLNAILQLPGDEYLILYRLFVEQESANAVAEELRVTAAAIRKKKERILKKLGIAATEIVASGRLPGATQS